MSVPAFIFFDAVSGQRRVAALTVLERLVIAVQRADCAPITLVGDPADLPVMARALALGIAIRVAPSAAPGEALVADGSVLARPADIARVIAQRGRLVASNGAPLPLGIADAVAGSPAAAVSAAPTVPAHGPAALVRDARSAADAEMQLWASLNSETDGIIDRYFNRPLGRILSKLLVHTAVSPNQVSVIATLLGTSAAFFFARGTYAAGIVGAVILQCSAIIDCVDGDLARVLCKESPVGKWLDLVGDQVVHLSIFTGLAVGAARSGSGIPALALGLSVTVGVVISFAVVVFSMSRPADARDPRLQRVIDGTTNRDFSVVLLALAAVGRLGWFLWVAAVGVHVFWVLALALYWRGRPSGPRHLPGA